MQRAYRRNTQGNEGFNTSTGYEIVGAGIFRYKE